MNRRTLLTNGFKAAGAVALAAIPVTVLSRTRIFAYVFNHPLHQRKKWGASISTSLLAAGEVHQIRPGSFTHSQRGTQETL